MSSIDPVLRSMTMNSEPIIRPKIWTAEAGLILASGSATRRAMLASAGLMPDIVPAAIDERALEARLGLNADSATIAAMLASAKAMAVGLDRPDRYVLGADQTLAVGSVQLHKAADREGAKASLVLLSGRSHSLHSGLALAHGGRIVWSHVETATLHVRVLTPAFIESYLDLMGDAALKSVGAYQYEGIGVHLFERISGDQSTILGLPLLPLLAELRRLGLVLE